MKTGPIAALGVLLAPAAVLAPAAQPDHPTPRQNLPAAWTARWDNAPLEDRPLQIVHGIPPNRATPEGMGFYTDRGLGGLVCNVAFDRYMQHEEHWKTLIAGVEACRQLGMVVWLYDEEGYPSGAAGGLVLRQDPAYEATALVRDPSDKGRLWLRPAYEHTHASNNFHKARRYPNLLDDRATRCFISKTHQAYWQRLQPHFGRTIRAIFTDEPSLMAINLGQLSQQVRRRVPVADPIDPAVRPLPGVPWAYDLPQQYRQRYGEDLQPRRESLFGGNSPQDRKVRRQYWALVADLVAGRYFGQIQQWCGRHGIASTGHSLWEEELLHHVPLQGNGLKVLGRMDIPGLDVLSSDPQAVLHSGWLTAALPASAAMLSGRRRVMTEVSDFSQKMAGQGPASPARMQATAAWQAAWGVTDFTLYYAIGDRTAPQHRAYCDYVGRLNAVLKPARPTPKTLLYYPIWDLWAEYLPVAEPLKLPSQSPRARRIVGSFMRLGQLLQRSQVPFCLVDHEHLAQAKVRPDATLTINGRAFDSIVFPEDVELPSSAGAVVAEFRRKGGRVVGGPQKSAKISPESLIETLKPARRLTPPSEQIALGEFVRDGRRIVLLVNVAEKPYQGHMKTDTAGVWHAMDPAAGSISPAAVDPAGRIPLSLPALQASILVCSKK